MRAPIVCLADAAAVSVDGKLVIHGIFDVINSSVLPAVWPLCVFVAQLKVGEEDIGQYPFELRVLDEDMDLKAVIASGEMQLSENPNPGIETAIPIVIQVLNASYEKFGTYTFCLMIDNQEVCSCPIHVRPMPPIPGV